MVGAVADCMRDCVISRVCAAIFRRGIMQAAETSVRAQKVQFAGVTVIRGRHRNS